MRHSDSEPELTIPEEGLWGLGKVGEEAEREGSQI